MRVAIFAVACLMFLGLSACSVGYALRPDGTPDYERPITGFGGGSTSAEAAGGIVGQIAGALGIPGAGLIGTAVTAAIGLFGVGAVHQRGRYHAEKSASEEHDRAWDEAEARARGVAAPPPGWVPAAPAATGVTA